MRRLISIFFVLVRIFKKEVSKFIQGADKVYTFCSEEEIRCVSDDILMIIKR